MDSSAESVCCQQRPPASLDHASFLPSPNARMYACSDTVAPSCPRSPDMHGRSVLDAHDPSRPPAHPHLTASPDAHAHSAPSSFPRSPCTTAWTSAPARLRAHHRTHFDPALTLLLPSPTHSQQRRGDDNDVTITPSRLSRRCCDHPPTLPLPALSPTPLALAAVTQ